MYFRNYGPRKPLLDKCLKSPVSEGPSKSNMLNQPKHCLNLNHSNLTIFIINGKIIELEKVSLSNKQNLRTVCEHIDSRSLTFSC